MFRFKPLHFVILTVFLLLLTQFAYGQAGGRRTVKLATISVQGNRTADANFIKLNSGLTENSEVSGEDIQKAIKQLWALNMFSDIQIILEKEVAGSVYLIIRVEEYPRLDKIELDGNSKVKKKDIEKQLDFYKGQVLSPVATRKAAKKIKKLYEDKGYLLAQVEPEIRKGQNGTADRVVLRLKIKEGNKVQIEGIHFHGNTAFNDKKLRKAFKETKENGFWFFGGGDFEPEKYQEDLKNLITFYNKEGFRDAEVLRDSIYYG
ncbi:MAG: POTRA domain-containing protein, partial [bacterium]